MYAYMVLVLGNHNSMNLKTKCLPGDLKWWLGAHTKLLSLAGKSTSVVGTTKFFQFFILITVDYDYCILYNFRTVVPK